MLKLWFLSLKNMVTFFKDATLAPQGATWKRPPAKAATATALSGS